jgi:hypothetical protein
MSDRSSLRRRRKLDPQLAGIDAGGLAELPVGVVVEQKFLARPGITQHDLVRPTIAIGDDGVPSGAELRLGFVLERLRLDNVPERIDAIWNEACENRTR